MPDIESYYKDNYDKLVKSVSYRVGSMCNAEDVVQEAFTRALQYKDSFRQDGNLANWFAQILRNCVRDFQQDLRMNGMTVEFEEDHDELVEDKQESKSLLKRIEYEIDKYRSPKRDILSLIFLKGFKPKEVPKEFNVSPTSVWQIACRFRAKMMDRYGELV